MSLDPNEQVLLDLLVAQVEFIVVGGLAAVLQGAPVVTFDVDIVHRRTTENVEKLHRYLMSRGAYHRLDLANRRLPPQQEALLGRGHLNLAFGQAKLDVLCEIDANAGYDELLPDTEIIEFHRETLRILGLPRLIQAKSAAGRGKDKMVLPILVATLEAKRRK